MEGLTDPWFLALKAAFAASVAVFLTEVLHVSDQLSAGFVAVACVSPTAYAGLKRGGHQVVGSILGGGSAALLGLVTPHALAPIVVLVSVFVAVVLCLKLRMAAAYATAGFTAVYVVALPYTSATIAVETRLLSVVIGIAVATVTNLGVSAVFGERVVERRMRIARARVAETLAHRTDEDADARFEAAFAIVSELRTDLEAAQRELFSGRTRRAAERHLAESIRLRQLLHVAKTLVLLGQSTSAEPTLAEAIGHLTAGTLDQASVDAVFAHLGPPQSVARRF